MSREKGKVVIQVFDNFTNSDGSSHLVGTYNSWEIANSVLADFKRINKFAYAIEDSNFSDMTADWIPAF